MKRLLWHAVMALIVGMLASCASRLPEADSPARPGEATPTAPAPEVAGTDPWQDTQPLPAPRVQGNSRWVPVRWAELPGFNEDNLFEAWTAWIKSCERPGPVFAPLCAEVRQLSIASAAEQRAWMVRRLQPHRVESLEGQAEGLLTSYYEPVIPASRLPTKGFGVPLYRAPASLGQRRPWYTRQEIESLPEAQAALRGREIAWIADPVEAMVLHIQGSGRLRITEPDGSQRMVRLAFAATNDQPYKSIGRWLLDQNLTRDATWPGIRQWLSQNPQRSTELLWSNPRYVFFKEEALSGTDPTQGPRGAQGVELTPGRSIAVERQNIPYGTPVWLVSSGPTAQLQRLVMAQDTGSAIIGPVRADYFAGWGADAGELAGRLKQPLRLWALWPR
ncbi:MltA domain-containing protein [Curvibacter sp. HBC61]|uniref:peptidoglycan lytic exotransglycosylase n=1 Tax=Curvibacter cyanobacteriorum TaxID=3026422 RepID=A0ABT5MZC0_9BURK|nr:MltA domain-containing protein [Curvibacter sp. HBC61]MDD0839384.1 MltA domain-containing protein [Curvibacter sp. HBC61]